ncbi:hypothetical protein HDU92_002772 [Lobulomyces angularis]|nr:hypothetical protein HDU92_002772 [Lobulomyces angularis]
MSTNTHNTPSRGGEYYDHRRDLPSRAYDDRHNRYNRGGGSRGRGSVQRGGSSFSRGRPLGRTYYSRPLNYNNRDYYSNRDQYNRDYRERDHFEREYERDYYDRGYDRGPYDRNEFERDRDRFDRDYMLHRGGFEDTLLENRDTLLPPREPIVSQQPELNSPQRGELSPIPPSDFTPKRPATLQPNNHQRNGQLSQPRLPVPLQRQPSFSSNNQQPIQHQQILTSQHQTPRKQNTPKPPPIPKQPTELSSSTFNENSSTRQLYLFKYPLTEAQYNESNRLIGDYEKLQLEYEELLKVKRKLDFEIDFCDIEYKKHSLLFKKIE